MINKLKIDFDEYIKKRFPSASGAAASYFRAITCVLDYLGVDTLEKSAVKIAEISAFAYSPKNKEAFLKMYPNFKIGDSYIEKGWITAGIKHFELFLDLSLRQIGLVDENIKNIIRQYDELELESILNFKDDAGIRKVTREVKERVLDNSIITALKKFYMHRCQICEKKFADTYSVDICEGHHIEHFVKSFDNSPDNIIVLCPDHHRIMHVAKPTLDRGQLQFMYNNGHKEKIRLVDHFSKVS